jgi:hypothetical protein
MEIKVGFIEVWSGKWSAAFYFELLNAHHRYATCMILFPHLLFSTTSKSDDVLPG